MIRSRVAIDVGTMVDAVDPDRLCLVVDAVEESVGAASGTVVAGELTPERLADAPRFAGQVSEGEFNDRCQDPRRQLVESCLAVAVNSVARVGGWRVVVEVIGGVDALRGDGDVDGDRGG
jgi:hypothetical protein